MYPRFKMIKTNAFQPLLTETPTPSVTFGSNEALELRALKASESQKALRTRQEAEASMEGLGEDGGLPLMAMGWMGCRPEKLTVPKSTSKWAGPLWKKEMIPNLEIIIFRGELLGF